MMNRHREQKGFTLIELLVALVILGVVAGLSVPVLLGQVEKSRANEAMVHLDAAKNALLNYKSLSGTYVGASFANMKYDPGVADAGQTTHFSYSLGNLTATTYQITAQREPSGSNAGNTIVLDQTGTITRNGVYA